MRIQHNIMAMNSYRNYNNNASALSKNLEKLSSGYKINRAGDDAAGLAISEKMRAQIQGLNAAQKNVKDGISLVKTAEGAMQEIQDMLSRMKYLATQSANGTYDDSVDRVALQDEVDSLREEIDRIADSSNFNGIELLNGKLGKRDVSGVTATANGIMSVSVNGGGDEGQAAIKKVEVKLTSGGTLTLKNTGAITGVKWEFKTADGKWSTAAATATANLTNVNGGVVTFRAVVTVSATAAKAGNLQMYNGMTISVRVDGGKVQTDGSRDASWTDATATVSIGGFTNQMNLQIGDTSDSFNQLGVTVQDMHVTNLGIDTLTIASADGASEALDMIKNAINQVSSTRGKLGAIQNRLEHTQNNLSVMTENIQDAESTIRDTDVADEMMAYTKNNILIQSAQAMLAQANAVPQGVLQLLQ